MAISIQKALELPIMKDTSLVAGVGGIKNNIKWVTTVEIIEDIKRLQEGEFLITTGFGLLENKSQMKAFHDLITSQLLSGIAIYTSFYMKEIPASFIDLANEHELPLIEIPTDINFSEITKVLLEQIVNNQMHLLEEAENVHRKLTNLILNDWSLNEVTTKLANLTNATIVIYNELHEIIYHSNGLDSHGHLNEDLFKKMDMSAIMQDSLEREEKVNIIDKGHMYTIYPIIAKQSCYGWIFMKQLEENWKEINDIAIEQATTIYALEFLKQQAIEENQLRLQNNFLEDIFNNNFLNAESLIDQGLKFNYDLTLNQVVFYIAVNENHQAIGKYINSIYPIIERILRQRRKQYLIKIKINSVMFLTSINSKNKEEKYRDCNHLAREILSTCHYHLPDIDLIVGVGGCYQHVNDLGKSANEARQAVELRELVDVNEGIIHHEQLGMYDMLLKFHQTGFDLSYFYEQEIIQLVENEKKQHLSLIHTLDVFFQQNQNIQNAAEELFIHRHTLRYRLKQVEEKTNLSLKSSEDSLKLQLGVMAYKLSKLLS